MLKQDRDTIVDCKDSNAQSTDAERHTDLSDRLPKVASAALLISILSGELNAHAQTPPDSSLVRVKYVHYSDFQAGGDKRMKVGSPMLWVQTPLTPSTILESSALIDTTSGASPLYLDTLSGASGKGIHDQRHAGDLRVTEYFEDFSIGVGGTYSNENDYLSRSTNIEVRKWTEDKNTTFAFGLNSDWDVVSSSNNPALEEGRKTKGVFLGVTQVLSPVAIIQSNVNISSGHGYFTDPYKLFDNRPSSRDAIAWLTRLNYYLEAIDGALHVDYRLFNDSWGVTSHTIQTSLYQPIGEWLTLSPRIRYYYQQQADFFTTNVPTTNLDRHISADQRLSNFGAVSLGMKAIAQLAKNIELDVLYEYMQQSSELGLRGNDGRQDVGAHYLEFGMAVKF